MRFTDIAFDDREIISFHINGEERRYHNPFMVALQAMIGDRILEDYQDDSTSLVPRYDPINELYDRTPTRVQESAIGWLMETSNTRGRCLYWRYEYPLEYGGNVFEPGWVSAFAQAYVTLAFLFFYHVTKDEEYRAYSIGALEGLIEKMEDGGCANELSKDMVWFEEIPGKSPTHIFNAHIISLIALDEARRELNTKQFDSFINRGICALDNKIEFMDTGTKSAYDIPDYIDVQLMLDFVGRSDAKLAFGSIALEDVNEKHIINLSESTCFDVHDNYASGVDWTSELTKNKRRKIIFGREKRKEPLKMGSLQNTYVNFQRISTKENSVKLWIDYETNKDITLVVKKNSIDGYVELGGEKRVCLKKENNKVVMEFKVAELFNDVHPLYHSYHICTLKEVLKHYNNTKIKNTIERFEEYAHKADKRSGNTFKIRCDTKLNDTNKAESTTYIQLFEEQEKKHKEMENATFSFLDTIPDDVETIADVGAGPGIVNRYIPKRYKVIAIDMDEEILKRNTCDTCLGDILDLPLEDDSVDLSIACDVLEHIEPDSLQKAVSEMKRVSKKYIYLQTPNEEILRYGIAWCPNCGNKWHVNFHKNAFTEEDYRGFEDEEWKIARINYTGEVDNQFDNPEIYKTVDMEDVYRVNGFTCPRCSGLSVEKNVDKLYKLEKEDNPHWRLKQIKPKYSEIGVLFYRVQNGCNDNQIKNNTDIIKEKRKLGYLDLRKQQRVCPNYTGKEQIAFVLCDDKTWSKNSGGIHLYANKNVGFAFPYIENDAVIQISCDAKKSTHIIVVGVVDDRERMIGEKTFIGKKRIGFNNHSENASIIRLYTDSDLIINEINVDDRKKKYFYYLYTKNEKRGIYKKKIRKVVYSFLIPHGGVAFEQEI